MEAWQRGKQPNSTDITSPCGLAGNQLTRKMKLRTTRYPFKRSPNAQPPPLSPPPTGIGGKVNTLLLGKIDDGREARGAIQVAVEVNLGKTANHLHSGEKNERRWVGHFNETGRVCDPRGGRCGSGHSGKAPSYIKREARLQRFRRRGGLCRRISKKGGRGNQR